MATTLHKEYHTSTSEHLKGKLIKFSVSFNREQYNWATSQRKEIGYQVTVIPVERSADGRVESFTAFSGFNATLLPVNRQSSKRLAEAIKILSERKDEFLKYINEKNF